MAQPKNNTYLFILLGVYISLLLYFMFFGFGRPQRLIEMREFRYSFEFSSIPLWMPDHFSIDILKLWIFAVGNLLAFVPFGILVPMLFEKPGKSCFQFIVLFVFFIVCMELLQMVTYLGSFDLADIFINTAGAAIGYCSYRISGRMNTLSTYFVTMGMSILGFSVLMFFIAWIYNSTITPYLLKTLNID
ncbi:VanZ family protein [Domibacillus indicus]|uniref:VanZ family protein n=1 Tax=Domibacillus indicus TaxID=1437523 RepID=UPI000697B804|nr:VanZ family protein [Domibacillus indicus]